MGNLEKKYLLMDFGQSTIKAMLGHFNGTRIDISEIKKIDNGPVSTDGSIYWDILYFYKELQEIIKETYNRNNELESIGITAWGADFGLLDKYGKLLGNPVHNRDKRTENVENILYKKISKKEIFEITGVQYDSPTSSMFQLASIASRTPDILNIADKFLMIPDLLNYFLTGKKVCEYSDISITQLMNRNKGNWSERILNCLGIPGQIFPEIVNPGTLLGKLRKDISELLNCPSIKVISTLEHDTASAFAAVPDIEKNKNSIIISMGTWCILGLETEEAIISEEIFARGFANMAGMEGSNYLFKNISGLWIAQECRKKISIEKNTNLLWPEIIQMAEKTSNSECFINVDNPCFGYSVEDMPGMVREYCKRTDQSVPQEDGQLFKCLFKSLVLRFKYNIDILEKITGKKFDKIYLIGGASRNNLLCQWLANLIKIPVIRSIYEASSLGNMLTQLKALNEIKTLNEGENLIVDSIKLEEYYPEEVNLWNETYSSYMKVLEKENLINNQNWIGVK